MILMPEVWIAGAAMLGLGIGAWAGVTFSKRTGDAKYKKLKRMYAQEAQLKASIVQERNELRTKMKEAQEQSRKMLQTVKDSQAKRIAALEAQLAQLHQLTRDLLDESPGPGLQNGAPTDFAVTQPFDKN